MTIGNRLRQLRTERGLTQKQLSMRADVSQQLISQIENDITLSAKFLPDIAKALGVHPTEFDLRYVDTTESKLQVTQVPVLTTAEIIAEAHVAANEEYVSLSDLPPGDWIGKIMMDDAIDRVAPAGAIMVVNRAERELEEGGLYMFSTGREVICRRYRAGKLELLLPFSINPEHIAEPYHRPLHTVIGRCRRSVLEI